VVEVSMVAGPTEVATGKTLYNSRLSRPAASPPAVAL